MCLPLHWLLPGCTTHLPRHCTASWHRSRLLKREAYLHTSFSFSSRFFPSLRILFLFSPCPLLILFVLSVSSLTLLLFSSCPRRKGGNKAQADCDPLLDHVVPCRFCVLDAHRCEYIPIATLPPLSPPSILPATRVTALFTKIRSPRLDTVLVMAGEDAPLARLNKLLRLSSRTFSVASKLSKHRSIQLAVLKLQLNPSLLQLLQVILFIFLAWHWIGCIWWFIGVRNADNEEDARGRHLFLEEAKSPYLTGFYWAVMLSTGVGSSFLPTTAWEAGWQMITAAFGIAIQAYVLGVASNAIANFNIASKPRRERIQKVRACHKVEGKGLAMK